MKEQFYAGFDIHKKSIAICVKNQMGETIQEKSIRANPIAVARWVENAPKPFAAAMEATLFTGWVYDELCRYSDDVRVGNSVMLSYISKSKNKSDKVDAKKLADLLRVDLIPQVYMLPRYARDIREFLRYRNWLVRQSVRYKNKISGLLMMNGIEYNASKLHNKGYFYDFLDSLNNEKKLVELLRLSRSQLEILKEFERRTKKLLYKQPGIKERVELLTSVPGVGEITALTWALEIWDPHRFSSSEKAKSYCGLTPSQKESAGKEKRMPISKQRNKHIQWVVVEASKIAVHRVKEPELVQIYQKVAERKNRNAATMAVARKLVEWLLAVDKRKTPFRAR